MSSPRASPTSVARDSRLKPKVGSRNAYRSALRPTKPRMPSGVRHTSRRACSAVGRAPRRPLRGATRPRVRAKPGPGSGGPPSGWSGVVALVVSVPPRRRVVRIAPTAKLGADSCDERQPQRPDATTDAVDARHDLVVVVLERAVEQRRRERHEQDHAGRDSDRLDDDDRVEVDLCGVGHRLDVRGRHGRSARRREVRVVRDRHRLTGSNRHGPREPCAVVDRVQLAVCAFARVRELLAVDRGRRRSRSSPP